MTGKLVRRIGLIVMVAALVTGAAGWVESVATDKTRLCKITGDWAKTVDGKDLPQHLAQLREIPKSYRGALWGALSPAVQSTVMRETFQAAIDTGTLTGEQVEFLETAITTLTPEYYAETRRLNIAAATLALTTGTKPFRDDELSRASFEAGMTARRIFTRTQFVELLSPFRLAQTLPTQTDWVMPTLQSLVRNTLMTVMPVMAVNGSCGCTGAPSICDSPMPSEWCMEWIANQAADCLNNGGNGTSCTGESCDMTGMYNCGFYSNVQCTGACTLSQ